MIKNEELILKVEKMVNEGKGLARVDGFPVFIQDAVVGDVLKVKVTNCNKHFAFAQITDIVQNSEKRVKPLCSMFNVCGSCDWQHIDYNEQLVQKKNIVQETIKNITGKDIYINDTIAAPKTKEYRCKVQYPVSQKKSGRLISGYYKKSSHELVNIKYCPMHDSILSEIMEYIKESAQKLNISGYNEKFHSGTIRHVVLRQASFDKKILVILVLNSNKIDEKVKKLAKILCEKFSQIIGVCANFNTLKSNVILGKITEFILGQSYYIEKLSNISYRVSANSFFQVNPYSAQLIFDIVKTQISNRLSEPTILDAYAGVSSFGVWLADIASKVVSVEEVKSSSLDAEKNVEINNVKNVEIINGDAAKIFNNFKNKKIKFDVVLIDPPRKGSTPEALENVISLTSKYLIYVSCNPATLARDLKYLIEKEFIPEYVQPVDMFPNTSHIETVVVLKNCNKKEAI